MSSKKGGDMALINFMVFLMLFLFGLICLLAALGGPNGYYDDEDDEVQDPNDDEITEDNYSTMMDLGSDDPDEEAGELIDFSDE